ALAFGPDGHLVSGGDDGTARVWLWRRNPPPTPLGLNVDRMSISPNLKFAAAASGGAVGVWNVRDGQPAARLPLDATVDTLGFAGDGLLIVGTQAGAVYLWEWQGGAAPTVLPGPSPVVRAVITSDG